MTSITKHVELTAEQIAALYDAANKVVLSAGHRGELSAYSDEITLLEQVLHEIDGGVPDHIASTGKMDRVADVGKGIEPVWWNDFIRHICELTDRNSPEGEPDVMMATTDELRSCYLMAIEYAAPQPAEPTKVDKLRELVEIQCTDGNWDYDEYMRGMANGMLVALSVFDGESPVFKEQIKPVEPTSGAELSDEELRKAFRRAYQLGQTYWQQADSDSFVQHKKSDATQAKFEELVNETCTYRAAIARRPVRHSNDGSLTVEDAVNGVMDLYPGADRQALQCLAELMAKPASGTTSGAELSDEEISAIGFMAGIGTLTQYLDDDQWNNIEPRLLQFARAAIAADRAKRAPVQQVPLTDNQIRDALKESQAGLELIGMIDGNVKIGQFIPCLIGVARVIEQAHGIAAAAPTPPVQEGKEWIEWIGGECPVSQQTLVDLKLRNGEIREKQRAGFWFYYFPHADTKDDIIAYRVVEAK